MNKKAISSLALIILMLISAVIGGIIAYMLTIAYYVEIGYNVPVGKTTLTITDIYFDPKNAKFFIINVLNPSYSVSNATITRIAVSIENETTLYDITDTNPSLKRGIVVPLGNSINITCLKVRFEGIEISWGRFAGKFPGKNVTVHVFSPDGTAANKQFTLPYAKLDISPTFDPKITFENFSVRVTNLGLENLTITGIGFVADKLPDENIIPHISEGYPLPAGKSVTFTCEKDWHGVVQAPIYIYTKEGYEFAEELKLPVVFIAIDSVEFNESKTESFEMTLNVTAYGIQQGYINVTSVNIKAENTTETWEFPTSVGINYNSSILLECPWNWKDYRDLKVNVTVHTIQGITAVREVETPAPIIVKALNKEGTFSLEDKEHFNLTLQNHFSSLEAINITKIVIKETGEVINGSKAYPHLPFGPLEPGNITSFYCNITVNWKDHAGKNLTLIVYAIANETFEEYEFKFTFLLPAAKLNITGITRFTSGLTKYLNITVENSNYSVWNLTISKVIVTFENQTEPFEQEFVTGQISVMPGSETSLLCAFNWEELIGKEITVKVITEEGIEASWSGTLS